jgi:hypothetical protein
MNNEVSSDILNIIKLSDDDIIGKYNMLLTSEHCCTWPGPKEPTTITQYPITLDERNNFQWQAESALRLRKEFIPETKIIYEQLLIIAIVPFRKQKFGKFVAACQSVHKKT